MSFLSGWFSGFDSGLRALNGGERERLLCECGRKCADTGVKDMYIALYRKQNGDMDAFFERLCEAFGGRCVFRITLTGVQ